MDVDITGTGFDAGRLHRIAELTNAGLNLEGVKRVMDSFVTLAH